MDFILAWEEHYQSFGSVWKIKWRVLLKGVCAFVGTNTVYLADYGCRVEAAKHFRQLFRQGISTQLSTTYFDYDKVNL